MAEKEHVALLAKLYEKHLEKNISLPMIHDSRTQTYLKYSLTFVIFQDIKQNIKKQIIQSLLKTFKNNIRILTTDVSFTENAACSIIMNTEQSRKHISSEFVKACNSNISIVVLDDYFASPTELAFYFYVAQKFQYVPLIIPPLICGSEAYIVEESTSTLKTLIRHYFFAIFLNLPDSQYLRKKACQILNNTFQKARETDWKWSRLFFETCEPMFIFTHNKRDQVFCAMSIFDELKTANEYFEKMDVKLAYGRVTRLTIVGFIISPNIIAAKVKLNNIQQGLWNIVDEKDDPSVFNDPPVLRGHNTRECPSFWMEKSLLGEPKEVLASTFEPTARFALAEVEDPIANVARGNSSHIILGKNEKSTMLEVDFDVQFAVEVYKLRKGCYTMKPPLDVGEAILFTIGHFFYLGLKKELYIDGFCASRCVPVPLQDNEK